MEKRVREKKEIGDNLKYLLTFSDNLAKIEGREENIDKNRHVSR
ncbi:hypothetical protein [Bacillus sp. FJAT-27251]|nr:hypothetical protein [Bacillus sp. FJAT-27251]